MPVALLLPADPVIEPLPRNLEPLSRKKFTREEVERLDNSGYFGEKRCELIDGELIDKMGQNSPHVITLRRIMAALVRFIDPILIQVQMPIEAAGVDRELNVPEPDIAVLESTSSNEEERITRGDEVVLAVEVSDTTVRLDLSRKAALYARAGVREYWVFDINSRRLVVHRQPRNGAYTLVRFLAENDSVSIEGRAESIRIGDILPSLKAEI